MDFSFTGEVIEWRGPAPFYFIETPAKYAPEIKAIAADKSYGWGVLHAMVTIKNETFKNHGQRTVCTTRSELTISTTLCISQKSLRYNKCGRL